MPFISVPHAVTGIVENPLSYMAVGDEKCGG